MINNRIISFSLFNYNKVFDSRWWDSCKNDLNRYYYNIPFLLIQIHTIFPDFHIKFYIEQNIDSNFLNLIKQSNVDITFVNTENKEDMSKTLWRYFPVFDGYNSLVFPRDIDSVISKEEIECYKTFESSNFDIMTIRSHATHSHEVCKMLAGMSGFKPVNLNLDKNILMKEIQNNKQLECDQKFLIKTFCVDKFLDKFLDFRIHEQNELPKIKCKSTRIEKQIPYNEMFCLIDNFNLCEWAGIPCDSRKEPLIKLFELVNDQYSNKIKTYIQGNKVLNEFYL